MESAISRSSQEIENAAKRREAVQPQRPGEPWWQPWLEAAGAGTLVALPLLWLHLTPDRQTHYHELLPMNSVYQGLLIDFVIVLLACRMIFWLLQRWDPERRTLVWLLVTALLVVRLVRGLVIATWVPQHAAHTGWIFMAIVVAGVLLWWVRRAWYRMAMRGVRWTLVLLGFSILWLLPELTVMAFHAEPQEAAGFSRPVARAPERRIVWILFDEASYDQLFDHRQAGIDFPEFDALAHTSVSFSDVRPAGYYTEEVIPSLFEGETITQEKSDLEGRLFVRTKEDRHWRLYPDERTVFGEAQRAGWSTGAVGWYNPYCRILERELDDCFWTLTIPLPGHYVPDQSAMENAVAPLGRSALGWLGRPVRNEPGWQIHTKDYEGLMAQARKEIAGDRIGFLFLHLPLPHPGGIYNRQTHQIGVDGSYLDNLVLTDQALGELLHEIQQSRLGPKTTVIVSSDHSWRIRLWQDSSEWRPEDTRVSGGRFDPRPLLMVHFPGEDEGGKVTQPFPLIAMHGMIERMLGGGMTSATDLQTWAAQQTASGAR